MLLQQVIDYFKEVGLEDRISLFDESSATVQLAAKALGCEEARIAKTMSFYIKDQAVLVVTAGDMKVDNRKFRDFFHQKAKMIPYDQVEEVTNHVLGGVCPFRISDDIKVYLDLSLQRFDYVYPAVGSANSAIKLTISELEKHSFSEAWVDVCTQKNSENS